MHPRLAPRGRSQLSSALYAALLAILLIAQPAFAISACGWGGCERASGGSCCCASSDRDAAPRSCCARGSEEESPGVAGACDCGHEMQAAWPTGSSAAKSLDEHAGAGRFGAHTDPVWTPWVAATPQRELVAGALAAHSTDPPGSAIDLGSWRALRAGASGRLALLATLRL